MLEESDIQNKCEFCRKLIIKVFFNQINYFILCLLLMRFNRGNYISTEFLNFDSYSLKIKNI
jgi:hypothetical protein